MCPTCGVPLANKAFGCDGTGRIAGGIGSVPGFRWWPIKAYRPCPRLEAAGVRYLRKGQITDEVNAAAAAAAAGAGAAAGADLRAAPLTG